MRHPLARSMPVCIVFGLLLLGGPIACSRTSLVVESTERDARLVPYLPTAVFMAPDENTADVYLTDLTADELDPGTGLNRITGHIVHIHMFLRPRAGRTPIQQTACSATVRHAILAGGSVGLYGGGGFLLPDGSPTGQSFSASMRGATVRLIGSTDGFTDLLGTASLSTTFSARRDEAAAEFLAARLREIASLVRPAAPPSDE